MTLTARKTRHREDFIRFVDRIQGPSRYGASKYRCLIAARWEDVKRLALGERALPAPSYIEIHVTDRCNLNCDYCRGELRDVPQVPAMLDPNLAIQLIDDIAALNPEAFIRFSGIIGESLLVPGMADVFARVNSHRGLRWGLTTNGILLHRPGIMQELLAADYVHVSIDAGTDETYQQLKKGWPGNFQRVLSNLRELVTLRTSNASKVRVIASLLLQSENFREIPLLSRRLRTLGADEFEIKMQHFDEGRGMTRDELEEAYRLIDETRRDQETDSYRILAVQNSDEAVAKLHGDNTTIGFRRCYANLLGLNGTIDPHGNVQTCCQYYDDTLAEQGNIADGLPIVWQSEQRMRVLDEDPRQRCSCCSPSDEFVNRFVEFLRSAVEQDPTFLDWAEDTIAKSMWEGDQ